VKASDCGRHAGEAIEPQLMVSRHSSTAMVSGMQVKLPIRHARRQSSTVPAGRTSSTQGFSQIRLQSSVPSDPPAPDALPLSLPHATLVSAIVHAATHRITLRFLTLLQSLGTKFSN